MNEATARGSTGSRFLGASGEMAARMAAYDWSRSPLGPPSAWPLSLQTAVRIALRSRFAMWLCWGEALTFFCNDAYLPTLGVKRDWALGASARKVWEEIWPDIGPRIDTVLSHGVSTWDEGLLLYLERSGVREETYHTFSYSPLSDDDGSIRGMLCVVNEETTRIVAERRVIILRDVAAALAPVHAEPELFAALECVLSRQHRPVQFSLTYLRGGGGACRLASSTGVPAERLPALAREPAATWPLDEVIGSGGGVLVDELARRFGGAPQTVASRPPTQALALPITVPGQALPAGVFIVGLNPDRPFDAEYEDFLKLLVGQIAAALASARAYEGERRRAEQLAELDRAKTAFFSNVSHEFRTPLTLMLGPTEAALATPGKALTGEDLQLVHRNELRLLKLVNSLLDFARIEAGRMHVDFQPIDLGAFTAELASAFRSATARAGLGLEVDCPALAAPVPVDRDFWEKIVLNLVSNAFKYTLVGRIAVSLRAEGAFAVLRVRDTGTGIPPADLPRIFDRFHRVPGARGRTHEGTGIGLALVRELVQLHGGTVTAKSTLGSGSTFTVAVPLWRDGVASAPALTDLSVRERGYVEESLRWIDAPPAEDPVPANAADDARPRVLLADDNADMRDYIRRLLAPTCDVTTVNDGLQALDAVRRYRPDLVLSDVMMPRLDGFELLRALRADPSTASIPLLLLSARVGEEARIEGLRAGADDYLTKPFSARELVARVNGVLELARTRKLAVHREAKFKAETTGVLESMNEGFVSYGPDWRCTYANRAAETLLGATRADMIGKNYWELYPTIEGTSYGEELRRVMRERVPVASEILYEPWQRWFEASIYPNEDGGISMYFRDISERKAGIDALHEADRRKDEFLATLAHELRNPLSPIRNAAEILHSPKIGARELAWSRGIIQRQVQHMARLLDDLLDISRITRGKLELKRELIALDTVLDTAIETARPLIDAKRHALKVFKPTVPHLIEVDPVRLAQVLGNLLTNAAKYTDAGGKLVLTVTVNGRSLNISMRDSGVGLTPEQLPQVFDMFSQIQTSLSRSEGGLGIGLALVKGLVEMHGGQIEARSAGIGCGAEFVLRLPVVREIAEPADATGRPGHGYAAVGRRVLVADDNRDAAESLAMLLELAGHEVKVAIGGRAALRHAADFAPDIAFLDIGMPDLNGYEVARALRAAEAPGQHMTLVALTGWGQAEDKQNAADAGFDQHLVKPADPNRLHALMAQLPVAAGGLRS